MTAFFIPETGDDAPSAEQAYDKLRQQIEVRMGRAPRTRRIRELWTRRGNLDCLTTVGVPDPICGDLVMAIFDMGPHQPFVVCHQQDARAPELSCAVLGTNAYTVSEFDP